MFWIPVMIFMLLFICNFFKKENDYEKTVGMEME